MAAVDPVSDVDDVDEREHLQRSLQCLPEELQVVAKMHLVGTSIREIGQRLDLSKKTVSRKLKIIRDLWRSQET